MSSNKIYRQLKIIGLLKANNSLSKDTIINEIEKCYSLKGDNFKYSEITFKRDLQDLRYAFDLEIIYNRKGNNYSLEGNSDPDKFQLLLESFMITNAIMQKDGLAPFIIPEQRKSYGIMKFAVLTEAINKKKAVKFEYKDFRNNESEFKEEVEPLALKESKNRWYLIGCYRNQSQIRAFGLDRIENLYETDFNIASKITIEDINEHYKDSFAMFTDEEVQEVVLGFDERDLNYIKTFPIHDSQKVEFSEKYNRDVVLLKIKPTLDFKMELFSRTWSIEVLEPLELRTYFYEEYKKAMERNL